MKRKWRGSRLPAAILRDRRNWRLVAEEYRQERRLQTFLHLGTWEEPTAPEWDTDKEPNQPTIWQTLDEIEAATLASMGRPDYARAASETLEKQIGDDNEIIGLDEAEIIAEILAVIPAVFRETVADAYWTGVPVPLHIAQIISLHLDRIRDKLLPEWSALKIIAQSIAVV